MNERIQLSTGFVRAAGYADKLRRTFFAITKGKAEPSEVAKIVAQINMSLFELFQKKKIEKNDVVRIRFIFDIVDGKEINIDEKSFQIEIFKYSETISGINLK